MRSSSGSRPLSRCTRARDCTSTRIISTRPFLAQYSTRTQSHGLVEFALHVIPETLVGAFEKGEVLPVLLLALLFGFALNASRSAGQRVQEFIDGIAHVLFRILALIMRLAPARRIRRDGVHRGPFRHPLDWLARHADGVVLRGVPAVRRLRARSLARLHGFSLWRLLRYIREELIIVLATSSTEPVLPRLIVKLEALGCEKGSSVSCCPPAIRSTSTARRST